MNRKPGFVVPKETSRSRPLWQDLLINAVVAVIAAFLALGIQNLHTQSGERKQKSDMQSRIVVELLANQNVLRWQNRLAQVRENLIWNVVNCYPTNAGMINYDRTKPCFERSIYDAVKPDLFRLGNEDALLVFRYYEYLQSLTSGRERIGWMYDKKDHEFFIRQFYESVYGPAAKDAYALGAYLLARFRGLSMKEDPLKEIQDELSESLPPYQLPERGRETVP